MFLFAFHVTFLFLGNVTNIPAVLHPSSSSQGFRLLTICCQHFKHQPIVFCVVRPTHTSLALVMGALVSRRSRARALPSLNLKKKRDCSQSIKKLIPQKDRSQLVTKKPQLRDMQSTQHAMELISKRNARSS